MTNEKVPEDSAGSGTAVNNGVAGGAALNGASLNGAAPPSGTYSGALNTYDSGAGGPPTSLHPLHHAACSLPF
jgi:hypothetical protein